MKGYGQFCPIAMACEVLTERWTPLVLRELLRGSRRFGEIHRGVPLMSRSLLVQRLRALEAAGVVASAPRASGPGREYRVTAAGDELRPLLVGIGRWGERWSGRRLEAANLDARLLLWKIRGLARAPAPPAPRVVVRVELRGLPRGQRSGHTWWLILDQGTVDLCLKHPGFESDVVLRAELEALTLCYLGRATFAEMIHEGRLEIEGPRDLARALPDHLGFDGMRGRRDVWAGLLRPPAGAPRARTASRRAAAAGPRVTPSPDPTPSRRC
jgi:DNA-binding HxlR family transcriptional regulator